MLRILPVSSSLNDPQEVEDAVARISTALAARGVAHRMQDGGADEPNAVLVVTGGTEALALACLERGAGPACLIAHPAQNSLPAALEILSRLRQLGRPGRIYLLSEEETGYHDLARLARYQEVRRGLMASRLGRIGAPSDWLVASMPDPGCVKRTWGPDVVDVPLDHLVHTMAEVGRSEIDRIRDDFVAGATAVQEPQTAALGDAARVAAALERVVREHALDACTVRCFDLVSTLGTTGCLGLSWLLDQGVVAGCEGDVPATVTMLWLQAMTGQPGFMANPQDLAPARKTLWLAHCTVSRKMVGGYRLRSHFESGVGVAIEGAVLEGPATLARVGGVDLRGLFVSDAEVIRSNHHPQRCRTQVEVRLEESTGDLLRGALGNHHVLVRGHSATALREYHQLFIAAGA